MAVMVYVLPPPDWEATSVSDLGWTCEGRMRIEGQFN